MALSHVHQPDAHAPVLTLERRLRWAREEAELDQTDLAALIDISARSIHNYEAGRVSPRHSVLLAWALATNVPVPWLLHGDYECRHCGGERMTCSCSSAQVTDGFQLDLFAEPNNGLRAVDLIG